MAEYKVVFEIQVSAESPFDAAEIVQSWLEGPGSRCTYVVQKDDNEMDNPIYLVDLEKEEEDDAVFPLYNYKPLISKAL